MSYINRTKNFYIKYIKNHKEESRFLILTSFTFTFILARLIVYNIKYNFFPIFNYGNIYIKQIHIHHLVFGIILLLMAGLIRVPQFGTYLIKLSSVIYGIGAALTLDEFSLWLKLNPNAYFGNNGRESLDAVILFALIILSIMWHGVFWRKIFKYTFKYLGIKAINIFNKLSLKHKKSQKINNYEN